MSAFPTSARAPQGRPTASRVVTAVLFVGGDETRNALAAVGRQGYETSGTVIVGGGESGSALGAETGTPHAPSVAALLGRLDPSVDFVWILHGDAEPRPDALAALVSELERNEASLVGSKILDAEAPDRLESVGGATDMFGEIYLGLDPGEVDLEQYDVVREVAFVSGVSLLVRRDLLKGLGGLDPKLPPVAAGLDLSQRARIAGGRVLVAPSSEVFHARSCRQNVAGWRELAGRMRTMLKAYRLVTLVWLVPAGVVVGVGDGVVRLFLGQWRPLATYLTAFFWSLWELPSTLRDRAALAAVRHVGDEELFRYQTSGSVRLRDLATDLGQRLGWIIDEEPGVVTEEELESEASLLGPLVATLVLLFLAVADRGLLLGSLPGVRFSAPVSTDPTSVLRAYAGGWNPAGLGGPEALHPAPAGVAALQWLLGGWTGVTALISAAALVAGLTGTARLLHRLGVTGPSRYLAAPALLLGPFSALAAGAGHWAGTVALGVVPWAATIVLTPAARHPRGRLGKWGAVVVAGIVLAVWSPAALLVPLVVAVVARLVLPEVGSGVLGRGAAGTAAGLLAVSPFLLGVLPATLVGGDPIPFGLPHPVGLVLLAVAGGAVVLGGGQWRVATFGLSLSVVGLGIIAVPEAGGEGRVAAVLLGALGSAVIVGAALAADPGGGWRRIPLRVLGGVAGAGVIAVTFGAVPGGRAGLPADEWNGRLAFASALAASSGGERTLLVGDPNSMPGSMRMGDGYAYRVVDGAEVTFDELWLGAERSGDRALGEVLDVVERGAETRPGALLADFAVRWIVVLDDAPLAERLVTQVDLAEVPLAPGVRVFENLSARSRVTASDGAEWTARPDSATGPKGSGAVRVADNADAGWGPGWSADGWANGLSAGTGEVAFSPDPLRRVLAVLAVVVAAAGTVSAVLGRRPT